MNPADEPVVTMTRAGIEVDEVALAVMAGDARAQRRDTERLDAGDRLRKAPPAPPPSHP